MIAIGLLELSKFRQSRNSHRSFQVLTFSMLCWLALTMPTISSSTNAQEEENKSPNFNLTPLESKSSLRPIEIDETLEKREPRLLPEAQSKIDEIKEIRKQMESSGLGELFGNSKEAERLFAEELTKLVQSHQLQDQAKVQEQPFPQSMQLPRQMPENQLRPLADRRWNRSSESNQLDKSNNYLEYQLNSEEKSLTDREIDFARNQAHRENPPLARDVSDQPNWRDEVRTPVRVANPFSLQPIPSHPGLRAKVSAVRSVASQLEKAAADLEMLQLYEDADTVRAAANGMWRRARNIESEELPSFNAKSSERLEVIQDR